ncbi:MAG: hypothetical protein R6X20_07430 [Phycisphaerae bacterium]
MTNTDLQLAIDPAKTRAIVLTWPDHSLTWEAAAWLYHLLPPENVFTPSPPTARPTRASR